MTTVQHATIRHDVATHPFNVVRFGFWMDPEFDRILSAEASIALQTCAMDSPDAVLGSALASAQVLQTNSARDELPPQLFANAALLERCPRLLAVSANGSGCDTIDIDACTQAGVMVLNQAGGNADSVAEMSLGLMLAVLRRIAESDRRLRSGERGFSREDLMGRELRGRTLGLVGMSAIGSRTAALGRAFGMRVLGSDPGLDAQEMARRGAEAVSFDELLRQSDIVSLHCPRNAHTLGLMNAARFATMKPGAIFITTARSGIHDEVALAQALASGHLAGAGLDVWEQEPPPPTHPLLALPNVVATYHTAGVTQEARRNNAALAATQIVQLLTTGQQPERLVNPAVWSRARERLAASGART
ncbi:hydroxyacid dehydrogenase [Variovorax sp. J22R133]|uniref:hydroxyacid dehydrogenase n=1 Tax=Variovorax brevis TaxID=3053503 RepID=UPI0025749290|nr:hydroxyacid dehydrogenase [Variovorax sp. J22R133]MDM0116068.1 hydroxyacid dehydrogenase [Variovorax sp. J22R133]